jgi:hypothetical protein
MKGEEPSAGGEPKPKEGPYMMSRGELEQGQRPTHGKTQAILAQGLALIRQR